MQTLACIVNGRPKDATALQTQATLIVGTKPLLTQWMREINLRCDKAKPNRGWGVGKVKIYKSSKEDDSNDPLGDLCGYDILLCTYEEVLKSYPLQDPPPEVQSREDREAWWDA